MSDYNPKEEDCPHEYYDRDIVFGMDSGDDKCRACGATWYRDSTYLSEHRARLAERKKQLQDGTKKP